MSHHGTQNQSWLTTVCQPKVRSVRWHLLIGFTADLADKCATILQLVIMHYILAIFCGYCSLKCLKSLKCIVLMRECRLPPVEEL